MIIFESVKDMDERLSDFLDSYFSVSAVNYKDDGKEEFVGYVDDSFDETSFRKVAQRIGIVLPSYKIEKLPDQNWLESTATRFEPLETKGFCIYGNHEKNTPKTKKMPIQISAATAFGSTHPTTVMCLDAFEDLSQTGFEPLSVLDFGTGSGILAVAAARKQKGKKALIYAIDIDKEAVRVARQNASNNGVLEKIQIFKGDGFKSESVYKAAPYDLVFANIFARPLISIAQDFQKNIKTKGYAILSGFMTEQKDWVLKAFEKHGFKVVRLYVENNWCAAVVQKKERISDIQKKLKENQAVIVCRNNMFLGEDILSAENKILELTGFTGSAGLLFIGHKKTWLFVDGRYAIQARMEVGQNILVVDSTSFFADITRLCTEEKISQIVLNPWAVSQTEFEFLKKTGLQLLPDLKTPISLLTEPKRVFKLPLKFAGLSSKEKCLKASKVLEKENSALLITAPDVVSWLSNLRAVDLPDTPVLRAYGLLDSNGRFRIYAFSKMKRLIKDMKKYEKILAEPSQTPAIFWENLENIEAFSFSKILEQKLKKNETELQGFQQSHIRDGVALVRFFEELEKNYVGVSELELVQKLQKIRAFGKNYFSQSFETIAAVDEHGAIVHYQPTLKTNKKMKKNALLLLDSGAQYFDGTTDVTRTVAFGKVPPEFQKDFTLVLKAHIALAAYSFDEGIQASALDNVCRKVLKSEEKDFKHGTGHSVGHFSDVHEAPFSINSRNQIPIKESYITSIEPGFYLENKYGIRIENLYFTKKVGEKLSFEVLTLFPIDLELIQTELLNANEKRWLNDYHQKVLKTLSPYLKKDERLWLEKKCRSII